MRLPTILLGLPLVVSALSILREDTSCHSFTSNLSLPQNASIVATKYMPANSLNVTAGVDYITNDHAFCNVSGIIRYGSNDTLHFSLLLPNSEDYNGRFITVGNGGMAGTIDTYALTTQLNAGFAAAGGDAGHLAALNNKGSGAPDTYLPYLHDKDQVDAWIRDAISLFVPTAKQLVTARYGKAARYSYYIGCSTGGGQAYSLVENYPDLFDGIVAGCPGNWYSHLALSFLWNAQNTKDNETYLPQATLDFVTKAALDECDSLDGVEDRLLEDPTRCRFDIESLRCNGTSTGTNSSQPTCLTNGQLKAVKAFYAGPSNPITGEQYYPGFSFGSETEWALQEGDLSDSFSVPILQNLVYDDLNYDSDSFNWTTDVKDVDNNAGRFIDGISTNLTAFQQRGGKIIVYQGWTDPFNAALWPIQHLQDIETFFGGDISDFYNLFMIPGGGHCGGASKYPGVPSNYHALPRLMEWVERGEKPRDMLSTEPADGSVRSRKLCPWPSRAVYVQGDIDDWTSYECES